MERSEPSLAPEWLKVSSTGSSSSISSNSSSGNSSIHLGPSSNSDDRGIGISHRNKLTSSASDHDFHRGFSFGERTSSSSSRRSTSSNGYGNHSKDNSIHSRSYSFGRSTHRNREANREPDFHDKERLHPLKVANGYHDHLDSSEPGRTDRGSLQRSQSLTARRHNDSWPRKTGIDTRNGILSTRHSTNGIHKVSFDKDFPSIGSEEKSASPIPRAHSPNLLPINGSSTPSIGGDGFKSLLVEMPAVAASNGATLLSARPMPSSPAASTTLTSNSSLNMAETLVQAPLRARTTPQVSVEAQRLEELALKQSKQLIPVTPKSSVLSMDKSKQKSRSGDMAVLTKAATQALSQHVNHTSRSITARSDVLRTPQVKNFQVLNRDKNGVHPTPKEVPNLPNGVGIKNTVVVKAPTVILSKTLDNLNLNIESRSGVSSSIHNCVREKKPSPQAKDRNEFFNALRKKASGNNSAANQGVVSLTSVSEYISEATTGVQSDCLENHSSGSDHVSCSSVTCNGIGDPQRDDTEDPFEKLDVLEEELGLLLSLGWIQDEGVPAITEEEKTTFYQTCMLQQSSGGCNSNVFSRREMLTEGSAASFKSITSSGSEAGI